MTSAKDIIVTALQNATYGVKVYDDSMTLLTGNVSQVWVGKSTFNANDWYITVGPVINVEAILQDLGSWNKRYVERVQVDVWVMEKRGANYVAERLRQDLIQEVDRCFLHYASINAPFNVDNWHEADEVGMRRSTAVATVCYEKVRA